MGGGCSWPHCFSSFPVNLNKTAYSLSLKQRQKVQRFGGMESHKLLFKYGTHKDFLKWGRIAKCKYSFNIIILTFWIISKWARISVLDVI